MTELRRIEPISTPVSDSPALDLGQVPELRWVPPTSLLVDENYQRDLGKRSWNLIRAMIEKFAWRKYKPPIVVEVNNGLHCVDGQHTAIAAASLSLDLIPVFVVGGTTLNERADSFVAHNRDRIVMSALDVYRAKIASGDPDAIDTQEVCRLAGVRIRQCQPNGKILVGDTNCVGTIQRLVKRRGVSKSKEILESFVRGARGPIGPAEIDAVEAIMVVARPETTSEQLSRAIRALGDRGVIESKMLAASQRKPQKHVLFEMYCSLMDKQARA